MADDPKRDGAAALPPLGMGPDGELHLIPPGAPLPPMTVTVIDAEGNATVETIGVAGDDDDRDDYSDLEDDAIEEAIEGSDEKQK